MTPLRRAEKVIESRRIRSSHLRGNASLVAFGAKRTFSEQRLPNRIYEYAP
jgi:hypothetical protein